MLYDDNGNPHYKAPHFPSPPLEEGDRVFTQRVGGSHCNIPLRGTVLRTWSYDSWEHADVLMDSGEETTYFVSDLEHEPPLETLARAGTTP